MSPFTTTTNRWRNGRIYRFAGIGIPGYQGDSGSAVSAQLNGPAGLAIDASGDVFIADLLNHAIRRVDAGSLTITTVAGTGKPGFSGDGSHAIMANLNSPEGVAVDREGNLLVADSGNQRIRRIDSKTGIISTIAGTGEAGFNGFYGHPLSMRLNHPSGVVVDAIGRIYFNDYGNDLIRLIEQERLITYVGTRVPGYRGDGGPAENACISDVYGMGLDSNDNLYFVDSLNFAVRKVDQKGNTITTIIGKGQPGSVVEFASRSEALLGGEAHPKGTIGSKVAHGVDVDGAGNIFIAETGVHRLRMVSVETGEYFTVAGNGEPGVADEGSLAIHSPMEIHGVRVDRNGCVYYVDFLHHLVNIIRF